MEYIEMALWIIGIFVFFLICGGLQRAFFPHTLVNGFMDLDKLEAICPQLFKPKEKDEDSN